MALISAHSSCQIYTPRPLADAMVDAVGVEQSASWLEPSFGKGVFLQSLAARGVRRAKITALDLDRKGCEADSLATTHRGVDFLQWSATSDLRFDRVVGNPPFASLRSVHHELRRSAIAVRNPVTGRPLSGQANLWFAFLCASLKHLRKGGNFVMVLPAAWAYADYASAFRDAAPTLFRRLFVVRSRKPLCEDVLDSSVVLLGLGYGEPPEVHHRLECEHAWDLAETLRKIRHGGKSAEISRPEAEVSGRGEVLGERLHIRLGGVTGQADYFLLNEMQRRELGLPLIALQPVLTRARHLTVSDITAKHWLTLRDNGERVWLFRPPESVLNLPSVKRYLQRCVDEGGCDKSRYKIRCRIPWHRTPLPRGIHGFISGMSSHGVWLAFRKMPCLNATNTLYTFRFKQPLPPTNIYAFALALLSSPVHEQVNRLARRYPGGLSKLEPGDLAEVRVPHHTVPSDSKRRYATAVRRLLAGDAEESRRLADAIIRG